MGATPVRIMATPGRTNEGWTKIPLVKDGVSFVGHVCVHKETKQSKKEKQSAWLRETGLSWLLKIPPTTCAFNIECRFVLGRGEGGGCSVDRAKVCVRGNIAVGHSPLRYYKSVFSFRQYRLLW